MIHPAEFPRIVIDEASLAAPRELHEVLEKLYLGPEQTYQVYVQLKHLLRLEKIMDEIIMKNGIRAVSFDYSLRFSLCGEDDIQKLRRKTS